MGTKNSGMPWSPLECHPLIFVLFGFRILDVDILLSIGLGDEIPGRAGNDDRIQVGYDGKRTFRLGLNLS